MRRRHIDTVPRTFGSPGPLAAILLVVAFGCSSPSDPGPDAQPTLRFVADPVSVAAGEILAPAVEVEVLGTDGRRDPTATRSVTVTLVGGPPSASLSGTVTVAAVAGLATFPDLLVERASPNYTLAATSPGTAAAASREFAVTSGEATSLVFRNVPTEVAIGATMPTVETALEDDYGNHVTSTDGVSIELVHDTAGVAPLLEGSTSVAPTDGVAGFDDLRPLSGATGVRLRATFGTLTAESTPFDVYLGFTDISTGDVHTCGVADVHTTPAGDAVPAGVVYCWGYNAAGQIGGDSAVVERPQAVRVARDGAAHLAQDVAAGSRHTCSLDLSGEAFCWGENSHLQLGESLNSEERFATPIGSTERFKEIDAGSDHTCAITTVGLLMCWGDNTEGQIKSRALRTTPAAFASPTDPFGLTQAWGLATGPAHTCVSGTPAGGDAIVTCRGLNDYGQLGTVDPISRASSIPDPDLVSMATAGTHSCGLTLDGVAYCWGDDEGGQLGDGAAGGSRTDPDSVLTSLRFSHIVAGDQNGVTLIGHTCALTTDGEAYCWGQNADGVFGTTSPMSSAIPVRAATAADPADPSVDFVQISSGRDSQCGLSRSGRAYCWGTNDLAKLGVGVPSTLTVENPLPVLWPASVILP